MPPRGRIISESLNQQYTSNWWNLSPRTSPYSDVKVRPGINGVFLFIVMNICLPNWVAKLVLAYHLIIYRPLQIPVPVHDIEDDKKREEHPHFILPPAPMRRGHCNSGDMQFSSANTSFGGALLIGGVPHSCPDQYLASHSSLEAPGHSYYFGSRKDE